MLENRNEPRASEPLVSVVIPSYNAARTIGRSIRSALDQDYRQLEIIVADDCSVDGTEAAVSALGEGRVVFHRGRVNRGAAAARNRGIRLAAGDYIAFLDADDCWLPSKISAQVRMMEANPRASLGTCDCLFCDSAGRPRASFFSRRTPVRGENAWRALLAYNFIQTSTVLVRRSVLDEAGAFSEALPTGEDQDLWIRVARRGHVEFAPEILVKVYDEPGSLAKRYREQEGFLLLAMVAGHIGAQDCGLSSAEIRTAWSERLFDIAANLFHNRAYAQSAPLFWRAMSMGHRPLKCAINMVRAALYGAARGTNLFDRRLWQDGLSRTRLSQRIQTRPGPAALSGDDIAIRRN
jgi:glycosyltransferase involved in cell wall biosynthesis